MSLLRRLVTASWNTGMATSTLRRAPAAWMPQQTWWNPDSSASSSSNIGIGGVITLFSRSFASKKVSKTSVGVVVVLW